MEVKPLTGHFEVKHFSTPKIKSEYASMKSTRIMFEIKQI